MVDYETVDMEIKELEARGDTTYSLCERLAWLYIVRDHLMPAKSAEQVPELRGSEFMEAVSGIPSSAAMAVIDEHMSALKVVQPREYETVMGKLRGLRK